MDRRPKTRARKKKRKRLQQGTVAEKHPKHSSKTGSIKRTMVNEGNTPLCIKDGFGILRDRLGMTRACKQGLPSTKPAHPALAADSWRRDGIPATNKGLPVQHSQESATEESSRRPFQPVTAKAPSLGQMVPIKPQTNGTLMMPGPLSLKQTRPSVRGAALFRERHTHGGRGGRGGGRHRRPGTGRGSGSSAPDLGSSQPPLLAPSKTISPATRAKMLERHRLSILRSTVSITVSPSTTKLVTYPFKSCQGYVEAPPIIRNLDESLRACRRNRKCKAVVCASGNRDKCTLRQENEPIPYDHEDCFAEIAVSKMFIG